MASRSATCGCARRCRWPSTAARSSRRSSRAWASSTRRCPPRCGSGRSRSTSSATGRATTGTIRPRPNGFPVTMCFTTYGSTILVDSMQLVQKYLKDVGIDAKLDTKEYGAYISTCFYGKFDSMAFGPQTPFLDGDNYLFGYYYPGEMKNQSHVNDPVVADMIVRQRRTVDPAKRREIIHDIQRYLAKQVYYTTSVGQVYTAVWDGALKNYGPNLGYDYGGRLVTAWLER